MNRVNSLSPVRRGEGRGERRATLEHRTTLDCSRTLPLSPALSLAYGGEGGALLARPFPLLQLQMSRRGQTIHRAERQRSVMRSVSDRQAHRNRNAQLLAERSEDLFERFALVEHAAQRLL